MYFSNGNFVKGVNDKVETRVLQDSFGSVKSILKFCNLPFKQVGLFNNLVRKLTKHGYVDNYNLRGAPYDFRNLPDNKYYEKLKILIEQTYQINRNKKVVILSHSFGGIVCNIFLNKMAKNWRSKYIKSLITFGTPWGGTLKSLNMILRGDNLNIPLIKAQDIYLQQRSMQVALYLLPNEIVWSRDQDLVVNKNVTYAIKDLEKLFIDTKYYEGFLRYASILNIMKPRQTPNVKTYCIHGSGKPTMSKIIYKKKFPLGLPEYIYGNGDGSVNLKSLAYCKEWKTKYKVIYKVFKNTEHTNGLYNKSVMNYIHEILDLPKIKKTRYEKLIHNIQKFCNVTVLG
ncbi:Lecithin-cholesterol acyltransferase [Intoshia linei]|uniref:Lecithin-cholesterol acyltransferase n=1 Tax=Intoshia linei TaxID=1819745 RepID=A0A177ARJ1_9BILA|nr:Lecithin-cholesterol acyltransferase [Intoshia linei]